MGLTTKTNAVATGQDCTVAITGLINPAAAGSPAYTVAVADASVKAQSATVPDTVTSAAITAAVVTLTDSLALDKSAVGATAVTATYIWRSDVTLATGTTITIVMPGFSGTAATSSTCTNSGNAVGLDITNTGSGGSYQVQL